MNGAALVTTVDGTRVAWTEQGTGEDLVLIHGIGDSQRTWRHVAPLLATRYRVLTLDLPGHGLSGRPDAPYTLTWFAGVVSDWMTAIGVPHAHMVGHSYGGGVAQWLVLQHRARVDRLGLIAAGGLGHEVGFALRLAAVPFPEGLFSPFAMWLGTWVGLLSSRRTFGYPPLPEIREIARMNGLEGTGRAFSRTVRGVIDSSGQSVQSCSSIDAIATLPPVMLFWGTEDRIIPVEHGLRAMALFRGATLTLFPGCGHYPQLEEPANVAAKLLAFLGSRRRPIPIPAPELACRMH